MSTAGDPVGLFPDAPARVTYAPDYLCGGTIDIGFPAHKGSVCPQSLQIVMGSFFLEEHMHEKISIVEEHPAGVFHAFTSYRFLIVGCPFETVLDMLTDRAYLSMVCPGSNDKVIRDRCH